MNILAIETSSSVLSVALKKGSEKVSETKLVGFMKHAENLLPMMDNLLKKKKLQTQDIDTFLIGRGPGSFTGLRIGFATLKGFLAAKKKSCFGGMSLDMIAANHDLPENSKLAVCLDARRQKIYSRFYQFKKGTWRPQKQARVLTFLELASELAEGTYVSGDALIRYEEDFKKLSGRKKIQLLPEAYWYPRASTLIDWYDSRDGKLKPLKTPRDFMPLYFRLSEAEEIKRHRHAATC